MDPMSPQIRRSTRWMSVAAVALASLLTTGQTWAAVLPASARPCIGAVPYQVGTARGVTFRTWAPNASAVSVAGSFNNWSTTAHQLSSEGNGF